MQDGFVKVAVRTPRVRVADVAHNVEVCLEAIREAAEAGARIIALPELCVTGYTCEDLFWQQTLLDAATDAVQTIADSTSEIDALIFVGAPLRVGGKLYNCAIALNAGEILGIVPKIYIPNYNEFYEARHFSSGPDEVDTLQWAPGRYAPFGADQLFACDSLPELVVAAEVCEDLWAPQPPSIAHALAGATLIVNLSASNAIVGKAAYRRDLVVGQSGRLVCGYMYASAGLGESTTDVVFAGHDLIAENGHLLAESAPFGPGSATTEIDVVALAAVRQCMSTFVSAISSEAEGHVVQYFSLEVQNTALTRHIDPHPFVPSDESARAARCEDVFAIQAYGLAKRLEHTHGTTAVIGISGGLDSTLALLVTVRAFDLLNLDRHGIIAVTMPGFGTTNRTKSNAMILADALGVQLREVSIAASVRQHFADIGHDESVHDVTYENAQARERTQIIMDIANQEGGLVVGTGDLSELALGRATYNGDHMSMYGVNGSVPKTLVRHLVRYVADTCGNEVEAHVLYDVLDTPVSPELLPANEDGTIAQQTEDLVGPYELHDFVLYQVLRHGSRPRKVQRLAREAFAGTYDDKTIHKWLCTFYRRFFAQQFKRSCLPDGPKVGSVAVSPRGDLRMPSDALATLWLADL